LLRKNQGEVRKDTFTTMKSGIKIIKRGQDGDLDQPAPPEEKSVEHSMREMANTVKGWIAELKEAKRLQSHSFARLTEQPGAVK
jgi:hypothetical protein